MYAVVEQVYTIQGDEHVHFSKEAALGTHFGFLSLEDNENSARIESTEQGEILSASPVSDRDLSSEHLRLDDESIVETRIPARLHGAVALLRKGDMISGIEEERLLAIIRQYERGETDGQKILNLCAKTLSVRDDKRRRQAIAVFLADLCVSMRSRELGTQLYRLIVDASHAQGERLEVEKSPSRVFDDVTTDPNVYFDVSCGLWYRCDPVTLISEYLNPQPRSGAVAEGEAAEEFQHSVRGHRRYSESTSSTRTDTISTLSRAFARTSNTDPTTQSGSSYTISRRSETNKNKEVLTWSSESIAQDAAVPGLQYQSVPQDPDLRNQGLETRARVYGKGDRQRLDPRFIVQQNPKKFFIRGRVIKLFWPELADKRIDNKTVVTLTATQFRDVQLIAKIRSFVVVKTGQYFCTCLPIATYGRRGVAGKGILKGQHCIVYTDKDQPELLPGEEPFPGEPSMRPSLYVRPKNSGDRMDHASRLNYGKMYTVEHNVRVYDFGMVHREYIPILSAQWSQIMGFRDISHSQPSGIQHTTSDPYETSPRGQAASSSRLGGYRPEYGSGLTEDHEMRPPPAPPQVPVYVDFGEASVDYEPPPDQDRQIAVERGDRLAVIEWPYAEWARAYNQRSRETGLVSLQYITLFESAIAKYDYEPPSTYGYVALKRKDNLKIIDNPHEGWSMVWNTRTAETGLAPSSYIQ